MVIGMTRTAEINRRTNETDIALTRSLDGGAAETVIRNRLG